MTTPDDMVEVEVTVRDVRPVSGCGRLVGEADVGLTIAGVEVELRGVRIFRLKNGGTGIALPHHRTAGTWRPSVAMPAVVQDAIADQVLDALREGRP
jgi:hypothetical protein